jgi:DNA-binding transcriptional regulator LsrR (DeoR family)
MEVSMSAYFAGGPAELVLTAAVARRYYVDGKSKVDIADEFKLSRFKVARMIDNARATGIVRFEIGHPGTIDVSLSDRVRSRFGLQHAVVIDTADNDGPSLRQHLGEAGAELLTEILTTDDVLGLAWARSVSAMAAALTRQAATPVIQLTGALPGPEFEDTCVHLVRQAARVSGGPAYFFHAPFIVPTAATARTLRRQPEIARAFARFASVTKAVVGVGRWAPGLSTIYDAADDRDRELLRRSGTFADISGVTVDVDGRPVHGGFTERMIGISAEQMRGIPEVIAIAYGVPKAPAVGAAIRSGLVSGLVTHSTLATALLEED